MHRNMGVQMAAVVHRRRGRAWLQRAALVAQRGPQQEVNRPRLAASAALLK
jgi:hypothetical protein